MEASSKTWFVIINPTSGNGSAKKKWPKIEQFLIQNKFHFTHQFTEHSNHGSELVQKAISKGILNIICIGGDGTLHNVVNGIMSQNVVASNTVCVGVIPIGTGNDWVKTYAIPKKIEGAIQIIKNGHTKQQDIGKVEVKNESTKTLYFNNLLGVGFDGYVVSKANKIKKFGALAYILGTLKGLISFNNFKSKTTLNSEVIEGKTLMVLIGLCKYSGGGMLLTETPNPTDGLFDVSIGGDFGKFTILKNTPKMFNGKVVDVDGYKTYKTDSISVEILENNKPFIEADGELIGTGNLDVSIMKNAFSFYAPN